MKVKVSVRGRGARGKRAGRMAEGFFVRRKGILYFISKIKPRYKMRQAIPKKRLRKN